MRLIAAFVKTFTIVLPLLFLEEVYAKPAPSSSLQSRQVIPQNPAYVVLSSGAYEDYTLLKLANDSRTIVTAGRANRFTQDRPPPQNVLQGDYRDINDNAFVPNNRGVRRPSESWSIGTINVRGKCLKASLRAPTLTLTRCQNGTLNDRTITWVNWGPYLNRGLGGYFEPFGNLEPRRFIEGDNPEGSDSWGFEQNQNWGSENKPVLMSNVQGSHITVIFYNTEGLVANQTVGF